MAACEASENVMDLIIPAPDGIIYSGVRIKVNADWADLMRSYRAENLEYLQVLFPTRPLINSGDIIEFKSNGSLIAIAVCDSVFLKPCGHWALEFETDSFNIMN